MLLRAFHDEPSTGFPLASSASHPNGRLRERVANVTQQGDSHKTGGLGHLTEKAAPVRYG